MFPSGGLLWFMNRSKTERKGSWCRVHGFRKRKNLSSSLIQRKFFFFSSQDSWSPLICARESLDDHWIGEYTLLLWQSSGTQSPSLHYDFQVNDSDKVVVSSYESSSCAADSRKGSQSLTRQQCFIQSTFLQQINYIWRPILDLNSFAKNQWNQELTFY